jgi:uncharacterized protein YjiS (DUF1127 family)
MLSTTPTTPTLSGLAHALQQHVAETLAAWRQRAETRRAAQRLQAELDSMTSRERQDIDVTRANTDWAEYGRINAWRTLNKNQS